jgi:CrcB protein
LDLTDKSRIGVTQRDIFEAEAIAEAELAVAPSDLEGLRLLRHRAQFTSLVAVGTGGMIGAIVRYQVGRWVSHHMHSGFPWGTFLINVTGSFIIGLFLTLITERFTVRATTRLFVATGFLGAYTTFSTFSFETVTLLQRGKSIEALAYVTASLLIGCLAAVAGIAAANAR